ncbi:insulinase family protein [bacterium]|nr:insulinase family protein [bacterium]
MKPSEYELRTLSSGMRWVHRRSPGAVAHLALVIKAGSRDELESEQGMAHFVEHCLFKGTEKRKTYHILSRLDDVGGELNAYTSKEETLLYATVLRKDARRALDLLVDIAFRSVFPEREIAKEQDVIIDEINSYKDAPSDLIFDYFDELLFDGHPLGRNILGTPEHLRSFDQAKTRAFHHRLYTPERVVIATAGSFGIDRLLPWVEELVASVRFREPEVPREPVNGYAPRHRVESMPYVQTHIVLGNRAFGSKEEPALPLLLLNNLLGGPGMNTRLNLNIRERYGLTYNLESFYTPYSDSGYWGVYLSTDPEQADRVLDLVHRELKILREKPLGILQLSKAKHQLQGQLVLGQENPGSSVSGIAKSLLHFDQVESMEEVLKRIDQIQMEELVEVGRTVFEPSQFSEVRLNGQNP